MSSELTENLTILHELLQLEEDWDNEGAKSFSKDFIDFVSKLIMNLNIQPDIFPMQNGDIVMEFGNVRDKYLEITISPKK